MDITRIRKPRCFLLYAIAPQALSPATVNQTINQICADEQLPLALYHDHFIGQAGGMVIFYAETDSGRASLQTHLKSYLADWTYHVHPLIYSHNPAAFDEQIAYTLDAYRNQDWEVLQNNTRPAYGNPREEAETAQEA